MTLANWRDLAVILLALEAFIISLVPGAILYFAVRGMLWLIRKLRVTAPTVQGYFAKAAVISEQASQRIAAPFIGASARIAQTRQWQVALASSFRTRKKV